MNDTANPAAVTWAPAIALDDLWEGDMTGLDIDGEKVLVLNVDGQIRAYRNRCPHQQWALDEGDLDGGTLTCSRHSWTFDALTGAGLNPDDCSLWQLPCQVVEGQVQVGIVHFDEP